MKTITVMGKEMELTEERKQRILSALIETQNQLAVELAYSEDLQKKYRIAFYRSHITKLEGMLS